MSFGVHVYTELSEDKLHLGMKPWRLFLVRLLYGKLDYCI